MPAAGPPTHLLQGLLVLLAAAAAWRGGPARAQGVELPTAAGQRARRRAAAGICRPRDLPRAVEDALQRGVPVYFVAQATLLRNRWYWRDERVARVQRTWRVAYQPLTGNLARRPGRPEPDPRHAGRSLAAVSRSAGWKLADLSQIDPDKSYYVEFSYRLDSSQLPGPMQIGLGGGRLDGGRSRVIVERTCGVGLR
jgi:hypothetical protein